MGRKKQSKGTVHGPEHATSFVKRDRDNDMAWRCMTANPTGSLVVSDDVTADSKVNSEVCRATRSAQVQPDGTKLIGWLLTVQIDNDTKYIQILKNELFFKFQVSNLILNKQMLFGY